MTSPDLLQQAIEKFWDTVPPVWGRIRGNLRSHAVQDFNLPLIQFHILRHIRHGAHTVCELAERQQISRPAVSQAVDQLVERGLVSRQDNPEDRRYVLLNLTEEGNCLLDAIFGQSRKWMMEKMTALTPDDLDTIMKAMTILKKTFDSPEEYLSR